MFEIFEPFYGIYIHVEEIIIHIIVEFVIYKMIFGEMFMHTFIYGFEHRLGSRMQI